MWFHAESQCRLLGCLGYLSPVEVVSSLLRFVPVHKSTRTDLFHDVRSGPSGIQVPTENSELVKILFLHNHGANDFSEAVDPHLE